MAVTLSIREAFQGGPGPHDARPPDPRGTTSLRDLGRTLWRLKRLMGTILGSLLILCFLYCLFAPKQYEAVARVEMRTTSSSSLALDGAEALASSSILTAPIAQETLAGVLRSDTLAWMAITDLRLDRATGFSGNFATRFPGFNPAQPSPEGQAWLLDRFSRRLHVGTIPRTLLVEIRFRSRDPALSAKVVNDLLRAYNDRETQSQIQATAQASGWLGAQLSDLKTRVDHDQERLLDYETQHGIVSSPEILANGQPGETQHSSALVEIDELSRQQVAATTDRILSEAEYRAASQGDPEAVIASDPRLQAENGNFATALLQQIHARRSDLEQEQAQLSAEHGPSFPRVVEISRQLQDLDRQKQAEDARLVERFHSNWQTAQDREQLVRKSLEQVTAEGMKLNEASTEYAIMRQEANASHDLYIRVEEKAEEAGLAAGVRASNISVIDPARQPVKPVSPDMPLYLAITAFAGIWVSAGVALFWDAMRPIPLRPGPTMVALLLAGVLLHGQAPTPNTSGLPTGVANFPQTQERREAPKPNESPTIWNDQERLPSGTMAVANAPSAPMAGPIGAGDTLDVSEFHTPEFHSSVRVSAAGVVTLPMIGEVPVAGLEELQAAHAIESALRSKGMLLHPLVSVVVTIYVGQDVSVLGEVVHPNVYPFTVHHRLLDLMAAAGGLSANAGRLVSIFHSSDPRTPHSYVLDPSATDTAGDHNPELSAGDTVQVSRAGLVYVVGDVIRPGGFPVDPAQGLTLVQALTLAWGPSQNAAGKAILIREENGGRVMTDINIKRTLRGLDPDQPVHDRDILYIPDSLAKNLLNRTLESAIQSTIGVSIYSGLVYSQRY